MGRPRSDVKLQEQNKASDLSWQMPLTLEEKKRGENEPNTFYSSKIHKAKINRSIRIIFFFNFFFLLNMFKGLHDAEGEEKTKIADVINTFNVKKKKLIPQSLKKYTNNFHSCFV